MNLKNTLYIGIAILLLSACSTPTTSQITNFEECVAAGNPIMESYPRQCKDGDQTFVEEVSPNSNENISGTLPAGWLTYENKKNGFEFLYPPNWQPGAESCLNFKADCDGASYKVGLEDPNDLGILTSGLEVIVIPTIDKQKVADFTKKRFDSKWFSFKDENAESQTYTFSATSNFDFSVKFIFGSNKTYIISPALEIHDVKFDQNIYNQIVSSFKTSSASSSSDNASNNTLQGCTKEFKPVCGEIEVQCIKAPCPPIKTTFENRCLAENEGAKNIIEGACTDENPDPEGACLSFDGTWIEEVQECEWMPKEMCENLGGTYDGCASACRRSPKAEPCTMQCVQVCQF